MNKWKIFGFTVLTWLLFSVIAKTYVLAMQEMYPAYSMIDGQSVVWSWLSLFMGVFMSIHLKKWIELLWGVLVFILSLFPIIGMLIGISYFAWCYTKLEKTKKVTEHGDN